MYWIVSTNRIILRQHITDVVITIQSIISTIAYRLIVK